MKNFDQLYLENIKYAIDQSAIVVLTDINGIILDANDKFCEISQYSKEELVGKTHQIVNSGYHSKDFFKNLWELILSGKNWEGELKNRAKDGSYYWVQTSIIPLFGDNQKIEKFISIRYDITTKKENEFNLQNLIESSNDGLIIYDLSGRIIWTNNLAVKIFGKTIEGNFFKELLQNDEILFKIGVHKLFLNSNGERKTLETLTKNYFYKSHSCYLVVIKDLTEKVRFESQSMYQERLATIGVLASGMAHEIGTPLGVLRGRAELIRNRSDDKEFVINNIDIVLKQIDRISALIKSLLGVSRGNNDSSISAVNILQVLEEVRTFLSHEIKKHNITLDILGSEENVFVLANQSELFQVILNLLVNSIYAIKEKSNKLHLQNYSPCIKITVSQLNEKIHVEIFDTGIGISNDNLTKIFSPFFSTKPLGQGTGLGLATAFRCFENWGGEITVESEEFNWTKFLLTFQKTNKEMNCLDT